MSAGRTGNPGSLKGYIRGWWGDDFDELVRGDAELRGWILDGGIARLREHPVASYFLARQRVSMPAYGAVRLGEHVEALMRSAGSMPARGRTRRSTLDTKGAFDASAPQGAG